MKIDVAIPESSLHRKMRDAGYHPDREQRRGFLSFSRSLTGGRYPRFHIYYSKDKETLDLHLDHKPNRYQGARDHGAEYSGRLVEEEVQRVKSIIE